MPSFADIILNDGQATPVAHTFKVKLNDLKQSVWEDRVGGIPVGYAVITVKTEDSASVRKVRIWVTIPTLEAISGVNASGYTPAQKKAYDHRSYQEFFLPQRGTAAERKNLVAFHTNLLLNTGLLAVIRDGEEYTG